MVKKFKYFNVFLLQKGEKNEKNCFTVHFGIIPAGGGIAQAEEPKAKAGQIEELESITVTSTKTQHTLADVPEETIVITAEELEKQNVTNAIDALRWIPGFTNVIIERTAMGQDNFQTDGNALKTTNDMLVLVDGNRVKGNFAISEIPIATIERIEIVRSGNSVLYGSDALAGVINIITKKPTAKVSGSVKMVITHDREEHPLPSSWGRGTYRKNYDTQEATVGFATAALRHQYSARHDYNGYMFEGYNVGGKWGVDLNEEMKIDFSLIYTTYKEQYNIEDKYNAYITFDWQKDTSNLKFKSFYSDYTMDTEALYKIQKEKSYEQELLYSTAIGDFNLLTFGYQNTTEQLDGFAIPGGEQIADDTKRTNSVFLQDEITIFDNLTFVPAVRANSHDKWNFNFDPKLSILWRNSDTLSLRLSAGTAYKTPSPEMLYLNQTINMGPRTLYIQRNPDLKPEKSKSIRLSAEQRFDNFFIGNLALFRTEYENRIGMIDDHSKSTPTKTYKIYVNDNGKTVIQGLEASIKYWLNNNILLASGYTYFDTENKGKTIPNTIAHKITPSIRYQDDELGFTAELRGDYEIYAPVKGQWQIQRGRLKYVPTIYDVNGADNFCLNANVSKKFTNDTRVWLNGENLLKNRKIAGKKQNLILILGLEHKF